MRKRILILTMILAVAIAASACGAGSTGVNVQRADQLAAAGQAGERFPGMVVSENVVEIQRDGSKTIEDLYVSQGQQVKAGDKLFTYDSAALELDLEKNQLEVEKMKNEQETYAGQLTKLEKQLKRTYNESAKVRLTLEINTLKTTQLENDYKMAAKEEEITKLQEMLSNIDITAPVDGTVRKINENGENGGAYITIQQTGAYRIKGSLNEMSLGSSLMPGSRVKIFSRIDSDATWMGTVASIDMEGGAQDNNNNMMGGMMMDGMSGTTSYPFYVDLDSVEGLLLGQHIYMEVVMEEGMPGLWIPENFLTDVISDAETGEMTATVFAENGNGKLEKRTVTLGMFDKVLGCAEILSGLTPEDYVADPMAPGCQSGAAAIRRGVSDFHTEISEEMTSETEPADADLPENSDDSVTSEEISAEDQVAGETGTDVSEENPFPQEEQQKPEESSDANTGA